jgi:F-box interacting protein
VSHTPTRDCDSSFSDTIGELGIAGIGHDHRNDTYKVARFFFFSSSNPPTTEHNFGVEVFTIGVDQQWRQTKARTPYADHVKRNPAFFKGSLFWTIALGQGESAPGFLHFRLEDESFCITPPPPGYRGIVYETSYLAELRGELGVAHGGAKYGEIEIWMCDQVDTDQPRWNLRYVLDTFSLKKNVGTTMYFLCRVLLVRQVLKDIVVVDDLLRDHHVDSIISYIPSLVPL